MGAIAEINPKNNQPFLDWFTGYNDEHFGMLQLVSMINKSAKVAIEFIKSPPSFLTELQRDSGGALGAFALTQVPRSTLDAFRSIQEIGQNDNTGIFKKIVKGFKSVMTCLLYTSDAADE